MAKIKTPNQFEKKDFDIFSHGGETYRKDDNSNSVVTNQFIITKEKIKHLKKVIESSLPHDFSIQGSVTWQNGYNYRKYIWLQIYNKNYAFKENKLVNVFNLSFDINGISIQLNYFKDNISNKIKLPNINQHITIIDFNQEYSIIAQKIVNYCTETYIDDHILYYNELNNLWNGVNNDDVDDSIDRKNDNIVEILPLNLILYGPPGTGKTYHTIDKALEIIDGNIGTHDINKFYQLKKEGRIVFTTFHQSMSYEDFIEGIKPETFEDQKKKTKTVTYEVKSGIFKQLCEKAKKDLGNKYVLIIDEINRGNVANIFGELITLIEEDKRLGCDEEITVKLPYSSTIKEKENEKKNEEFGVPSNLYIIGTMNTADRSVEALDTALRRRFSFEEMMPKYDLKELEKEVCDHKLSDILRTINSRIELLKDRDHLIGHSYLMKVNDENDLKSVFFDKIIPLLQEYFYGDYEKILMVLGDGFVKEEAPEVAFAGNNSFNQQDTIYRIRGKEEIKMNNALNSMGIQKTNPIANNNASVNENEGED